MVVELNKEAVRPWIIIIFTMMNVKIKVKSTGTRGFFRVVTNNYL